MIKKLFILFAFCLTACASSREAHPNQGHIACGERVSDTLRTVIEEAGKPTDWIAIKGNDIVGTAMQYMGTKYSLGHRGPNQFDCSGFTSYVYSKVGIAIGRSSRDQFLEGQEIAVKGLKKGDLVFFAQPSNRSYISHVGIVTEVDTTDNRFRFIHASRRGVRIDSYPDDAYYKARYVSARRIVTEPEQ